MKKGIIVEQKKRHTLMMTSDGSFYRTRKLDGSIGEETSFEPLVSPGFSFDGLLHWMQSFTSFKPAAAALIAILLILPFYSWLGEDDVHAYVNIDINPSVELSVNDDYEVIHLEGINEDGRSVVQQLSDWEHQSIKKVSSNILNLSNQLGYLEEDHQVLLGISFVNQLNNGDNPIILQEVSKQMETDFQSVSVASFEVPKDVREEAKKTQASMNLMYASKILENRDGAKEGQTEEDTSDTQTATSQTTENSSDTSDDDQEHQSVSKTEDRNIEVIEKFIQKTNKDTLPPGLKKQLEKYQELQQPIEEDAKENKSRNGEKEKTKKKDNDNDHPSNKDKGKPKGDDHPSDKTKNKDKEKPSNKENNNKDDDWTPPGHSNKDKQDKHDKRDQDDNGQRGFWEFFERNDREDDRSFSPPGLDKKEDDHPGNQNRNND